MGGKLIDFRLMQGTWYIEQVNKLIQSPLSALLQPVSLPETQLPRHEAHCKSSQGLPHHLRALQDTPLTNNPLGLVQPARKPIGCRGASLLQ